MLKKRIDYVDFNGTKRSEDKFFNLTKAEIMEMELSVAGGYAEHLKRISQTQDGPELVKIFKDLILRSYGEKSLDGVHFTKSPEISAAFACTEAYSELFIELATDAKAAAVFSNGIMPAELLKEAQTEIAKLQAVPDVVVGN